MDFLVFNTQKLICKKQRIKRMRKIKQLSQFNRKVLQKTVDKYLSMVYNCFTDTVKRRKIMKQIQNEKQLMIIAKEELYKLLQPIPSVADIIVREFVPQQNLCSDFTIEIVTEYKTIKMNIEVKSRGEKRFICDYVDRVGRYRKIDEHYMFIAPYISEESTELLRSNSINFLDLSGNCFISADMIYVSVQGKPNLYIPQRSNKNIFSKLSVKSSIVLRTMLNAPRREWQIQELAEMTGASLGMISNIKTYLIENNFAEKINNRFRLINIQDMLWEWARVYNLKPDETEEYYSLDKISDFEQQMCAWNVKRGTTATLGSFSAAARYAPTVRYSKTFVYVKAEDKQEFIKDFGLKKVENGGNIVICSLYDSIPTMFSQEINGFTVTSPTQTILDLLSHAGRGEEAAEAIIYKEFKRL